MAEQKHVIPSFQARKLKPIKILLAVQDLCPFFKEKTKKTKGLGPDYVPV